MSDKIGKGKRENEWNKNGKRYKKEEEVKFLIYPSS